jgi:hypothetical protein
MSRSDSMRWVLGVCLLVLAAQPATSLATECVSGPLPPPPGSTVANPDNRVVLCSPVPSEVEVIIQANGVTLRWQAPPRESTSYLSPPLAVRWTGVDSAAVVSNMQLRGTYLSFKDRRIQIDVQSVDSVGTSLDVGLVGRDRIRLAWTSVYEASASGAVAGVLEVVPGYAGQGLRFDVPNSDPRLPPDTTVVAGVRAAFTVGSKLRVEDALVFDVEDFEGWHVWRWGADPTTPEYIAAGEGSKLAMTGAPVGAWTASADGNTISFTDHNVFNGFLYHYAITAYDQGFRRDTSGSDLAVKFDSPLHLATRNADGSVTLGSTQIQVPFNQPPPETFTPITASPNPFRESDTRANAPETSVVTFFNAPLRGTLYVWTVSGDLVMQRDQPAAADGTIHWDTRNQSGEKVASGVYIYKIVDIDSGQQSYGRLAIIR